MAEQILSETTLEIRSRLFTNFTKVDLDILHGKIVITDCDGQPVPFLTEISTFGEKRYPS